MASEASDGSSIIFLALTPKDLFKRPTIQSIYALAYRKIVEDTLPVRLPSLLRLWQGGIANSFVLPKK